MIYQITTMRDEVAKQFIGINTETSIPVAIRNFESQVFLAHKNEEGLIFTNIDDFSLYKIGEIDTESGCIQPCTPELLKKANECDVI